MMSVYVILKPDGTSERVEYTGQEPFARMQEIVGGYIEERFLPVKGKRVRVYINEGGPGVSEKLTYNARATALFMAGGYNVNPAQGVRGNVIFLADVKLDPEKPA